jgi:hypothetical protein
MERLDSSVRRELGRFGPADGDMVEVVRAWPGVVGETVARSAWPARLARDGTLHVNAVSSTWAFELGRMAPTILEALRAELGEATPPALKFVPGPVPEPTVERPAEGAAGPPPASAEHLAEGAEIAAAIEDEELRATVARAAAASLARAARERAESPSDSRGF